MVISTETFTGLKRNSIKDSPQEVIPQHSTFQDWSKTQRDNGLTQRFPNVVYTEMVILQRTKGFRGTII